MPRASSRSSAEASVSSLPTRSRNGAGELRVLVDPRPRHAHLERQRDEPLLRAVVQVALDLAARGVGRLDDARARGVQLLVARPLDLAGSGRLLGGPPLGHVEHRAVAPQAAAGAGHELPAVEHPAHLAVGADDPVLEAERLAVVARVVQRRLDLRPVVGMDDAPERALLAGDEVRRRIARDPLDLVADQLEREVRVPCRAVDGARHVDHQRAHDRVVGALLGGAQAGARPREQLGAGERAVQVVVGAGVERGVGGALGGRDGEREQPGIVGAMVLAQLAADPGHVEPARLAVDDHQVGGILVEGGERRADVADRAHGMTGGADPRLDLGLCQADHEHAGLPAPHCSRMGHAQTVPSFACRSGAQMSSSTRLWCGA